MEKVMFRLPIEYVSNVATPPTMVVDLELTAAYEGPSMCECLYGEATDPHVKALHARAAGLFTTDVTYLKDTAKWAKKTRFGKFDTSSFLRLWEQHQGTVEFKTLYQYVDHDRLEFLNRIPCFLLLMTLHSLASPVMFLLSPIFILLIPFAMLNVAGKNVTWETYKVTLMEVMKKHALGGLILGLKDANANQIITSLLAAAMFGVQVYSNVQSCWQFYKSIYTVHELLESTTDFVRHVSEGMQFTLQNAPPSYNAFAIELRQQLKQRRSRKNKRCYRRLRLQSCRPRLKRGKKRGCGLRQLLKQRKSRKY
jgi:hypothetical protein